MKIPSRLHRFRPYLLFWAGYTLLFSLFFCTLGYTFPFWAGLLLSLPVQPLLRRLKKHMRPGLAAALATLLVYAVLSGLLFLLGMWLVTEISGLLAALAGVDWERAAAPLYTLGDRLYETINHIDAEFLRRNHEQIASLLKSGAVFLNAALGAVLRVLTSLPTVIAMLLVMVFSTYFFSKDLALIKTRLSFLIPRRAAGHLRAAAQKGAVLGGRYVLVYLSLCVLTFLETLLIFSLLRVPYPLVLSLAVGFADILPVLGPGLVYLPLILAALCSGRLFAAPALLISWLLTGLIRQAMESKLLSACVSLPPLLMLAVLYISLASGSFGFLAYSVSLALLTQIFIQTGALPPLFQQEKPPGKAQGPRA